MSHLAAAIKKVATGPHLSKDLSLQEAFDASLEILSGNADSVRAAIFFIALRIKRETHEENLGILQALQSLTQQQTVDVDDLLIFADPFNGFNRHCPVSVALPAVLAATGLPCLSQGVWEMGPKFGVTHAQVLKLAGYDYQQSVASASTAINDANIAWAYIDQSQATPELFALQTLRTQMIKRPSLATLEKMLLPLKAKRNHLAIGFVHKEYPEILAQLSIAFGYDSAFIARGLEGGIIPTLRETSQNYQVLNNSMSSCSLDPKAFGIEQMTRGVKPEIVTAQETLDEVMNALAGKQGAAYDSLVFGAAMMLWHVGKYTDQQQAAEAVREVLNNGKALIHFQAGGADL